VGTRAFLQDKSSKEVNKKGILNNMVVMFMKDKKVSCFRTVWSAQRRRGVIWI
jgi:hypothetical protein